ncbi:MAG: cytochrome P460 family protein [Planctomycetota bacterium]|jgi:hypothetical protein
MKKYIVSLLVVIFVLSVAFIANAIRMNVAIPYESILAHMPWPAAGDMRYHLIVHKPYKEWATWPGMEKMQKSVEPHGSFHTIYVNKISIDSIKKGKGMANNAIVVIENYAQNKTLMSVSVMYKVKKYNPDGGDWFWANYESKFNILEEGKVKKCLGCHSTVKDKDYIFSGKVTGQ